MTTDHDSEQITNPIRVLVANMSGVLLEIVMGALQQQPDMTIRHYEKELAGLALAVGDQTDVLIMDAPYLYPPPTICHDLWLSFPALKVLVMTTSGDAAVVYWLNVERHRLKTVSAHTLVNSIRRVHRLDLTTE
jgi:DNA-binding NarL/FixJ family response regulator